MNNQYLFEDKNIGIFEHNIDLLRNRFVYDKIEYPDIKSVALKKGFSYNWIVQLIFGLLLIVSSFLLVLYVIRNSDSGETITNFLTFWRGSKGAGLIVIIFLLSFGIYVVIGSLKQTLNLTIETYSFKKTFDIREVYKKQLTDSLIEFLKERIDKISIDKGITQPNNK